MMKFVTMVMAVAFTAVLSAAVMADNGWKIGNWEPPKNEVSPVFKDVSLGLQQPVAPATISVQVRANCAGAIAASCVGRLVVPACAIQPACFQQVGCAGRSVNVNGLWFPGRRMLANRQARAQARMGCN